MSNSQLISKRRKFVADRGVERVLLAHSLVRGLLGLRGPRHPRPHRDHHPRDPHAGGPRREGSPHPRAHRPRPEALPLPRGLRRALRREGPEPWTRRRRPVRVAPLQAPRRSCRPSRLLRCPPLRHGVGRQGLRGRRLGQAPRRACQVDEVHRRLHAPLGSARARLCRLGHPPRPHASGRPRYQGQDHEALGPRGPYRSCQAPPRRRHHLGAQARRRVLAAGPVGQRRSGQHPRPRRSGAAAAAAARRDRCHWQRRGRRFGLNALSV
ncbi:hypothetical protein OF846_000505 [Rhodotorula toruloides]|nr:hypothetical protein OF846_000505 [Rhodotorula toruloides]